MPNYGKSYQQNAVDNPILPFFEKNGFKKRKNYLAVFFFLFQTQNSTKASTVMAAPMP
jgi:hypothetical protein